MGRKLLKEFDGKSFEGVVYDTFVLKTGKKKGKRLYSVRYSDGDSEDLFLEEMEEYLLPEEVPPNATTTATKGKKAARKKPVKKTAKNKEFVSISGTKMFFLLDVETTGSKRNWDVVIVYAWMVVNESGEVLDIQEFRVNPGKVRIKEAAYKVHGICRAHLAREETFDKVGPKMSTWLNSHLHSVDTGVVVAHNGSTDFQFLCAHYIRHGLSLPPKLTHTLDTLKLIRRFASLAYRKASVDEWTEKTPKGRPSFSVNACATYVLSKRNPPTDFETECGIHHDAMTDVRGVGIIMFDGNQLVQGITISDCQTQMTVV